MNESGKENLESNPQTSEVGNEALEDQGALEQISIELENPQVSFLDNLKNLTKHKST